MVARVVTRTHLQQQRVRELELSRQYPCALSNSHLGDNSNKTLAVREISSARFKELITLIK